MLCILDCIDKDKKNPQQISNLIADECSANLMPLSFVSQIKQWDKMVI